MGASRASHLWLRSTALCRCVSSGGPGSSQAQTKKNRKGSSISRSCQEKERIPPAPVPILGSVKSGTEKITGRIGWKPLFECSSMAGSLWIPHLSVSSNLGFRPGQVYPRNSSSNLSWRLPRNKTGLQPGMWEVFFPKGHSGCAQ